MALNNEQIQKIRLVLASSGWREVMLPALANRGHQAVKALCLSRSERAVDFKGTDFDTEDEILRAMIRDCSWMSSVWSNEVEVADYNRRRDELDADASHSGSATPNA